jgi:hypothetical protein
MPHGPRTHQRGFALAVAGHLHSPAVRLLESTSSRSTVTFWTSRRIATMLEFSATAWRDATPEPMGGEKKSMG